MQDFGQISKRRLFSPSSATSDNEKRLDRKWTSIAVGVWENSFICRLQKKNYEIEIFMTNCVCVWEKEQEKRIGVYWLQRRYLNVFLYKSQDQINTEAFKISV